MYVSSFTALEKVAICRMGKEITGEKRATFVNRSRLKGEAVGEEGKS